MISESESARNSGRFNFWPPIGVLFANALGLIYGSADPKHIASSFVYFSLGVIGSCVVIELGRFYQARWKLRRRLRRPASIQISKEERN